MAIRRGNEKLTIQATPAKQAGEGLLGIRIADDTVKSKPGFGEAITLSVDKNIEMAGLIFQTLGGLFTRQTSPKQLMGPIAIRATLRRIGTAGLDCIGHVDGVDQPEPRAAET